MAQASPSTTLYSQAMSVINQLKADYAGNKFQTPKEIATLINNAVTKFNEVAGSAMTQFEPVYFSEIPTSGKMNRFWASLQTDVNILQDQMDVLNAASVFMHNFFKTEILKARGGNRALQNKLKTLELYSSVDDSSLLYFGDRFSSDDFIDWNLVYDTERASLISNTLMLGVSSQKQLLNLNNTKIGILDASNGFLGNNQEIQDPNNALVDPNTHQRLYTFVAEDNRSASLSALADDQPNSWLEFEKYQVSLEDRAKARNLNFNYYITGSNATSYLTPTNVYDTSTISKIDWADGVSDNILKFYFEVDLGSQQVVNQITLLPFGLMDNINNPLHIVKVSVSKDKTNWSVLGPENVWVSNSIDKKISNINSEVINVGSAAWANNYTDLVQYVRFEIQQPSPIDTNIGHIYYVNKNSEGVGLPNFQIGVPSVNPDQAFYNSQFPFTTIGNYDGGATPNTTVSGYGNIALTKTVVPSTADAEFRSEGPTPPVDDPMYYTKVTSNMLNNLVQKREFFRGKRWVIALRDIGVYNNVYSNTGVMVSEQFNVPGIVDRVAIEADVDIPSSFDQSTSWVKFYVSPNNGNQWFEISRIQNNFSGVPEIIAFNDPTPQDLRESGVAYYDTDGTATSIRVKIELSRPADKPNMSPIVRGYKLKVIKRG